MFLVVALGLLLVGCKGDSPARPEDSEAPPPDSTLDSPSPSRPEGLIWRFEGVADPFTVAVDSSGNGLDGLAEAPVHTATGLRPGRLAAQLPGGAGFTLADAGPLLALDEGEPLRVFLTLRTEHGARTSEGVLLRYGDDTTGFTLALAEGLPRLRFVAAGQTVELEGDRGIADARWHRITAGREADGTLVLGVDGVSLARSTERMSSALGEGALRLGDHPAEVDELRVERRAPALPTPLPERASSRVFSAGERAVDGPRYDTIRIPALVQTPAGTLLAFAEGRTDNACDFGDNDIVYKRSTDGGASWSALGVIADAGEDRVSNPIPIVDRSGRVLLLTTTIALDPASCANPSDDCTCESAGDPAQVHLRVSDDDGQSWGAPVDITADVVDPAWSSFLIGPGHGIQRADGSFLVAACHRLDGQRGGQLLVSPDGLQWSLGAVETEGPVNVNESSAVELPDGSILVSTRNQFGSSDVTWTEREAGLRGQASLDPALAWRDSPPYARRPDLRGPVVYGAILALPAGEDPGLEALTALSFPAGEHGTNYGQRHDLRLWTSEDGGGVWREGARIEGRWAAYSDLSPLGEAGVGVLVERAATSGEEITYYDHIELLALARQPLDDLTVLGFTFEGADPAAGVGPAGLRLGSLPAVVDGSAGGAALSFAGAGPVCVDAEDGAGWLDFGVRDGFVVEATFRTSAHASGGSTGSGALVSRTATHTLPAWWLRVQDGRLRFLVGSCDAETVNCGIIPGACEALTDCEEGDVWSEETVSDGAWHHVVAGRDPANGRLFLSVDGGPEVSADFAFQGVVKNEEPLCLGAFSDGARPFEGELDSAVLRLYEP